MNAQPVALSRSQRLGISVVVLICGVLVFVLGTNYYSVFPTNDSQAYRVILAALFLGAALALRRNESAEHYSHIAYAFFIATVTYFVTSLTVGTRESLFRAMDVPMDTPLHLALVKVYEMVLVVAVILILSKVWGNDLGSLYIKKGRLGLNLFIGLSLLVINTATGFVTGAALGRAGDQLVAQLPWALVFSLANGFMEELLFRGLFLRRFAAVIGDVGSIIVTSIVFLPERPKSSAVVSWLKLTGLPTLLPPSGVVIISIQPGATVV